MSAADRWGEGEDARIKFGDEAVKTADPISPRWRARLRQVVANAWFAGSDFGYQTRVLEEGAARVLVSGEKPFLDLPAVERGWELSAELNRSLRVRSAPDVPAFAEQRLREAFTDHGGPLGPAVAALMEKMSRDELNAVMTACWPQASPRLVFRCAVCGHAECDGAPCGNCWCKGAAHAAEAARVRAEFQELTVLPPTGATPAPKPSWPAARCVTCGAASGKPCTTLGGVALSRPHPDRTRLPRREKGAALAAAYSAGRPLCEHCGHAHDGEFLCEQDCVTCTLAAAEREQDLRLMFTCPDCHSGPGGSCFESGAECSDPHPNRVALTRVCMQCKARPGQPCKFMAGTSVGSNRPYPHRVRRAQGGGKKVGTLVATDNLDHLVAPWVRCHVCSAPPGRACATVTTGPTEKAETSYYFHPARDDETLPSGLRDAVLAVRCDFCGASPGRLCTMFPFPCLTRFEKAGVAG